MNTREQPQQKRFADPAAVRRTLQAAGQDGTSDRLLQKMEQHADSYFSSDRPL